MFIKLLDIKGCNVSSIQGNEVLFGCDNMKGLALIDLLLPNEA